MASPCGPLRPPPPLRTSGPLPPRAIDPLERWRRLIGGKSDQQLLGIVFDQQHAAMHRLQKACLDGAVEIREQRGEVAVYIEETDRFAVQAGVRPIEYPGERVDAATA